MTLITAEINKNLSSAFEKNFSEGLECGASVALYHRGEKIFSLHQGWRDEAHSKPWEATTLATLWSAGKGVAAACILHALQQKGIALEEKVAAFWPEFAQAGKEKITIAELLSHQAGLAALDQKGIVLTDHEAVVEALAAQAPNWLPDGTHGYGARTFGFLVDELLRRVSHERSLAHYWRHFFADPFELDLWFGVPEKELSRVADIIPSKVPPLPSDFGSAYADQTSLTRRAFFEPGGSFPTRVMNQPELRQAAIISSGAIGSAEALAKFYSLLTMKEGNPWFTPETQRLMQKPLSQGKDRVFLEETRFSLGFMMNCKNIMGRNPSSFGHPGAGGALAFADPQREIGFSFVPNAMQPGVLSGGRTQRLVDAIF